MSKATTRREPVVAPGTISIARHGRPNLDRTVIVKWREYEDWWKAYDAAGLAPGQSPSEELKAAAAAADVIFASTLPRAYETALAVADAARIIADPVFVEAPLPPPPLPLRMRPGTWGVFARIAWWSGFPRHLEPRGAVEQRAQAAAATLAARALRGENVLLCAHGWFNRMLRPILRRHGFVCVRDGGDGYWSVRRYERRKV